MNRGSFILAIVGTAAGLDAGTAVAAGNPDDTDRAYAAELKADAALRSSLLAADEGDSSIKLGAWGQFRYYMNHRENPPDVTTPTPFHDSGFTNGFEATRTRLNASGNIMSKQLTFKIEGQFSRTNGTFSLLDAWANYNFDNGWSVKAGQFKPPLLREELIPDYNQLAVGRSAANEVFSQSRSQGVQGTYQQDTWQLKVEVDDGLNTLNTEYTDPAEADFAMTSRVEFKGAGAWKDFDQFTSWKGNPATWLAGVAAHYQHNGDTAATALVVQQQIFEYTADFGYQGNGWNAYVAGIGRHIEPDTVGPDLDDFGLVFQGGIYLNEQTELYGRYDAIFADNNRPNNSTFSEFTAGVNWFMFAKSHSVMLTGDICWFPIATSDNDLAATLANNNNIGLLPSTNDNEFVVRLQLQYVY